MSVVVDFSVPPDDFVLGSALSAVGDVEIALESVVPTRDERVPYIWVRGEDLGAFEREVREATVVADLTRLERLDDDALYRVEWSPDANGLLAGLGDHGAAVLQATRLRRWEFRVRFHDHDLLRDFHAYCRENGVDVSVTRVAVLEEPTGAGPRFDLTSRQRQALVLAVREGYFEVPRRTDLSAIADELGVSQRATSNRIRRGVDRVLRGALLDPDVRHGP